LEARRTSRKRRRGERFEVVDLKGGARVEAPLGVCEREVKANYHHERIGKSVRWVGRRELAWSIA
jgi:hypothetical protein